MKRLATSSSVACRLSRETPRTKRGFTLMELMVSVAILLGIMTMIGMIFQTAGRASGRAKSDSAVFCQLRSVSSIIQADLSSVQTGSTSVGVIGIAGVELLAYNSPEDRASGRPLHDPNNTSDPDRFADIHHADVLMLLMDRAFQPFIYDANKYGPLTFLNTRLVVYGHADVGQLDTTGDWIPGSVRTIEGAPYNATGYQASALTACEWPLTRRIIGFHNLAGVTSPGTAPGMSGGLPNLTIAPFLGVDPTILLADVLREAIDPYNLVAEGFFRYNDSVTSANSYIRSGSNEYYVYDNNLFVRDPADGHWYKLVSTTGPTWERYDDAHPSSSNSIAPPSGNLPLPVTLPPDLAKMGVPCPPLGVPNTLPEFPKQWFYDRKNGQFRRNCLDASPPASLLGGVGLQTTRLAAYFLPSCSEFKVEYTYDDAQEIALDPSGTAVDMNGGLENPLIGAGYTPVTPGPQPIRWYTVPNGQQWVWSRLSVTSNNRTDSFRWPRALRITIRAYGTGGASQGAVEQSIIHCW